MKDVIEFSLFVLWLVCVLFPKMIFNLGYWIELTIMETAAKSAELRLNK